MPTKKTIILDPVFRKIDEIFEPDDLTRLHDLVDVIWGKETPMPNETFDEVKGQAYAVVTGHWTYGGIDDMPNLHTIMEVGGRHPSPQMLDYKACMARGIRVLSCAPAFGPMVAEAALAMVLASSRQLIENHNDFKTGQEKYLHSGNIGTFTLYEQSIGFIGYGGLARNLQRLLAPFNCQIQAYDPWLPEAYMRRQGVIPADLETVLGTSKVIFVLAIPSSDNKAMLDRAKLELIQPDAIFALISRAHMVDFDALTNLLLEERFKAVIDVFPEEPLPQDHPIRQVPGTVLSGHRAGSVPRDLRNIGRMVVNDLEAMLAGLPPLEMQVAQPEIISRLD